ncbi:MAG: hypothetical protein AAGJ52_13990 [Pseudomonadota bacterium]
MNKSVTIDHLPENILTLLEERASKRGQSLQEYLHQALVQLAKKPTLKEEEARRREDPGS